MPYCTQDDLLKMIPLKELAELTAESGDQPDDEVVAAAVSQADAEIDSYAGVRYQVPLSPVSAQVQALAVDLAIYHLYSRRSVAPGARRQKYEAAVAFLKDVAAGQTVLEGVAGELPSVNREVTEVASATRVFNRARQSRW